jgi:hypothetical protein
MQWEVWSIPTSNLLAAKTSEAEALVGARRLLASDWAPDELTLIVDDPSLAAEDLPQAVTGAELARRASAPLDGRARRTA